MFFIPSDKNSYPNNSIRVYCSCSCPFLSYLVSFSGINHILEFAKDKTSIETTISNDFLIFF